MMKRFNMKSMLSVIGCIVLIAAMALIFTGCAGAAPESAGDTGKSFTVIVTDLEGKESTFECTSDLATVGEALQAEGLLEGEEGPYGLYISAVNGIPLTWEKDQKYWAFYVDGDYALAGVDQTEITEGAVYAFKPEG